MMPMSIRRNISVMTILMKYPWLVYGIDTLRRIKDKCFSKEEFAKKSGVPKRLVRSLLYYLVKFGFIRRKEENGKTYYEVTERTHDAFNYISCVLSADDKHHLYRIKDSYVMITLKKRRISAYTISSEILRSVEELIRKEGNLTLDEISERLGMRKIVIQRAIRILKMLGIVCESVDVNSIRQCNIREE
ncbi:MAG: hypothetical protein DRZ82_03400 [Thermoprotei archaeon]|nr:MAG: hypothetical protein DRZ82_03400 [Thermoprotei archaeon]